MASLQDSVKVNLNQNLWGLVAAFGALGSAEHYSLPTLFWFSAIASTIMLVSVAVTTLSYTINNGTGNYDNKFSGLNRFYWSMSIKPRVGGLRHYAQQ